MHNMIIKDDGDLSAPIREFNTTTALIVKLVTNGTTQFNQFLAQQS